MYVLISHLGSFNFLFPELPDHCLTVIPGRLQLLMEVFFLA